MAGEQDEGLNRVEAPVPAYEAMAQSWGLIEALKGGTEAMRDGREKWLPQEPAEDSKLYHNRVLRSYLYSAYTDTVKKLVSKPFSRPVQLINDPPPQLEGIANDVDFSGKNLTQLGREMFTAAIDYGLTHVLVDMPEAREAMNASGIRSLEDEQEDRPVFVHVTPPELIGWQPEPDNRHGERVTQIRIKETKTEPKGLYGVENVEYVRVYTPENWQLWRKTDDDEEFTLWSEGSHSYGDIPLVTFYIDKTGLLEGTPALEDLAWMNLAHYQSMSDQRNLLRIARVPILFGKGFTQKEYDMGVIVGASQMVRSTSKDATLDYVEHSGKALGAGEADLKALEERMMILGLDPLISQPGGLTATGTAISEAKTHTAIQAWIRALENTMLQCYKVAARWLNLELDDGFKPDINNDFGISLGDAAHLNALITSRAALQISHETFLTELRRRGVLQETLDIQDEMERVEEETPPLQNVGLDPAAQARRAEEEPEPDLNENDIPAAA